MNRELHEMKLPSGPRGQALQHARRAVEKIHRSEGGALDEAFAKYEPAPRRTDRNHSPTANPNATKDTVQQIAAQLKQIDEQRAELTRLLNLLDASE